MTKIYFLNFLPDRTRHIANVLIVAYLLISPALFVNIAIMQDHNASCYVIGSEEQNERQPGKEIHGKSKLFLSDLLSGQSLSGRIDSELYVQREVILNSRYMDDVLTPPPRLVKS